MMKKKHQQVAGCRKWSAVDYIEYAENLLKDLYYICKSRKIAESLTIAHLIASASQLGIEGFVAMRCKCNPAVLFLELYKNNFSCFACSE